MVPALRPTGHFYAAFYRWSCSTVRNPHCSRSLRRCPSCFTVGRAGHAYSTTRPLLNNNAAAPAPKASRSESGSTSADQEATVQMKTDMRSIMRQVPSSVTVITAFAQDGDMRPLPLGSAISSLTTVSLDPPHVSFNIKPPSRTLDAIREAGGRFCLHFLDNSLLAAKVALDFTKGNSLDTLRRRRASFSFAYPTTNQVGQPPRLNARCVVASMTCQLEQETAVADHVVVIASVKELDAIQNPGPVLFYHAGKFKRYNGGTLYSPASAIRGQELDVPTLLHREGESKGNDGSTLQKHLPFEEMATARPRNLARLKGHAAYWTYPLFPGDAEKEDFISLAKDYVKQNRASFLESPSVPGGTILKDGWGIHPGAFGLNLTRLVGQSMAELGLDSDQEPSLPTASLTHRFYGKLSPTDLTAIGDHAKALVRHNLTAVDGDYLKVLNSLDVCPGGTSLLASDILVPLRDAGLIAPFELRSLEPTDTLDLYYLEQIEHRLSEFFKSIPYEQVSRMGLTKLQSAIGINAVTLEHSHVDYVQQVRPRITAEVYPETFSPPQVDLRGQISPEEVRVAVERMVYAFSVRDTHAYSIFRKLPKAESMRRLGIHPMATGADLDFLWEKLRYMRAKAITHTAFEEAVDTMLDPLFDKGLSTSEELYSRARKLVRLHARSVLSWSLRDIVAAMGLRYGVAGVLHDSKNMHVRSLVKQAFSAALQARMQDDDISVEDKTAIEEYLSSSHTLKTRPSIWSWDQTRRVEMEKVRTECTRKKKREEKDEKLKKQREEEDNMIRKKRKEEDRLLKKRRNEEDEKGGEDEKLGKREVEDNTIKQNRKEEDKLLKKRRKGEDKRWEKMVEGMLEGRRKKKREEELKKMREEGKEEEEEEAIVAGG
ncbi:hypothetical protein PMIN03_002380 [Paraphaeosphaeria minitans]|uniref:Flavin reductase like domain-containing protein n=1 Tax=Paraphaeosphaeria minitans TaxID=565426 RepID=A0A9P6KMC0_9PLEO|nr:flavin reductase like domain-containing protein [Paraphaeosphaeria minitans]